MSQENNLTKVDFLPPFHFRNDKSITATLKNKQAYFVHLHESSFVLHDFSGRLSCWARRVTASRTPW